MSFSIEHDSERLHQPLICLPMHPITGIATHDKLGQQFHVTGELHISAAGDWIGGIVPSLGTPLPTGEYTLRLDGGDLLKIRVTSMICRSLNGKRMQPFVGIGRPP